MLFMLVLKLNAIEAESIWNLQLTYVNLLTIRVRDWSVSLILDEECNVSVCESVRCAEIVTVRAMRRWAIKDVNRVKTLPVYYGEMRSARIGQRLYLPRQRFWIVFALLHFPNHLSLSPTSYQGLDIEPLGIQMHFSAPDSRRFPSFLLRFQRDIYKN
jgi:hypothetical protein